MKMLNSSRMLTRTNRAMAQSGTTGTGAGDITTAEPESSRAVSAPQAELGQNPERFLGQGTRG